MLALRGIRRQKLRVKIYLDGMIKEATAIHTTYRSTNSDPEPDLPEGLNPFLGGLCPGGLPDLANGYHGEPASSSPRAAC